MLSLLKSLGLVAVAAVTFCGFNSLVAAEDLFGDFQFGPPTDIAQSAAEPIPAVNSVMLARCDEDACCGGSSACRSPWYIGVSGAWQQRETVHEADDAQTFIELSDGFLLNAALGADFNWVRFEFETSFMNNEVFQAGAGGLSSSSPGNVNLRAYMFNVYRDIELGDLLWKPYIGAGIGLYQSDINSLNPEFFNVIGAPFAGQPVNATSDMPLAYQFRAGVTRPLGAHTEFYSGYRYFKGEQLEFASAPFASFAPTFHPDGAKIHALETGLRVKF